ncbi:MAG: ATP synthase F1 subunit delta [Thermoanaerobaculia bacterium]
MPGKIDEQTLAVAAVYADSLLELAEDQGVAETILEELAGLVEMLDANAGIEGFFISPLVDMEGRREALDRALGGRASDLLLDTLQVMNRKGRLGLVRALAEAYWRALEELRGEVEVQVTTAVPLGEEIRQRLAESTSGLTGRKARLIEQVDPALLGGMVITIGDRKIDTSVATELQKMHAKLLERASREIQSGRRYVER